MTTQIIGKTCTGCGAFKVFAEFYPHRRGKYGFGAACRECTNVINKEWRSSNAERVKEAAKKYRVENSERLREYEKSHRQGSDAYKTALIARQARAIEREATREFREKEKKRRMSEYGKAYRAANRSKLLAQGAAYKKSKPAARARYAAKRAASPDQSRAYNKAYREKNRTAHRIYDQNKRVLRSRRGQKLSIGLPEKLYKLQKGKCPCCRLPLGDDYHLDHKMPLALGGENTDDNMQLLRAVCNMQKHAKHPVDFMQSRGFLL